MERKAPPICVSRGASRVDDVRKCATRGSGAGMHRRGVGAGAIAKKKLAEVRRGRVGSGPWGGGSGPRWELLSAFVGGQTPPVSVQVSCQAPVFPCEGFRSLVVGGSCGVRL